MRHLAALDVARTAQCSYTRKPPKIDGAITEKLWRKPVMDLFTNDSEAMKTDSVRFYFAADSGNLYLAAICFDPEPESLSVKATERDKGVHLDDCVGWFLAPDTSKGAIYQVYFNPNAVVLDQKITVSPEGKMDVDMGWAAGVEVKAAKGKNCWSVEAKLPLAQVSAIISTAVRGEFQVASRLRSSTNRFVGGVLSCSIMMSTVMSPMTSITCVYCG